MNKTDLKIRLERKSEQRTVENLVRESFFNVYRPGCYEHYLLHVMRDNEDFIPELNLVLEKDGEIIGQTVFVKAKITVDDSSIIPILTMGPICIANDYKRQGYGKYLLENALIKAKDFGQAICLEGNISFYGKCGFDFASKFNIRYHGFPEGEDASFFLCRELEEGYLDGVSGEYSTPSVYFVNEQNAEEFDKSFPYKEKLVLPGQLF